MIVVITAKWLTNLPVDLVRWDQVMGNLIDLFSVACNSRGEIVVAESGNHRIQVFDRNGKFLFKFGSQGKGNGQFQSPCGVTNNQRNPNRGA